MSGGYNPYHSASGSGGSGGGGGGGGGGGFGSGSGGSGMGSRPNLSFHWEGQSHPSANSMPMQSPGIPPSPSHLPPLGQQSYSMPSQGYQQQLPPFASRYGPLSSGLPSPSLSASASSSSMQSSASTTKAPRARVTMACTHCRSRKIRCDGSQPSCSTCTRLGRSCHYENISQEENVAVRDKKRKSREAKQARLDALSHLGIPMPRQGPSSAGGGMGGPPYYETQRRRSIGTSSNNAPIVTGMPGPSVLRESRSTGPTMYDRPGPGQYSSGARIASQGARQPLAPPPLPSPAFAPPASPHQPVSGQSASGLPASQRPWQSQVPSYEATSHYASPQSRKRGATVGGYEGGQDPASAHFWRSQATSNQAPSGRGDYSSGIAGGSGVTGGGHGGLEPVVPPMMSLSQPATPEDGAPGAGSIHHRDRSSPFFATTMQHTGSNSSNNGSGGGAVKHSFPQPLTPIHPDAKAFGAQNYGGDVGHYFGAGATGGVAMTTSPLALEGGASASMPTSTSSETPYNDPSAGYFGQSSLAFAAQHQNLQQPQQQQQQQQQQQHQQQQQQFQQQQGLPQQMNEAQFRSHNDLARRGSSDTYGHWQRPSNSDAAIANFFSRVVDAKSNEQQQQQQEQQQQQQHLLSGFPRS